MTRKEAIRLLRLGCASVRARPDRWINTSDAVRWLLADGTYESVANDFSPRVGACGCVAGHAALIKAEGKLSLSGVSALAYEILNKLQEGEKFAIERANDCAIDAHRAANRVENILDKMEAQ